MTGKGIDITSSTSDVSEAVDGSRPTLRPLKILVLHSNTGSRFYRVIPQLKHMQRMGHQVQLEAHNSPDLPGLMNWCDVVIFQMVFSIELVKDAKAAGKTVFFECDDLIHRTHAKHYSYEETKSVWKQLRWLWRIWQVLHRCDGLIVSNENLKRVYGWMAKRTLVFGNYMELEHWLKEPKKNPGPRIRILWAGSTSHTGDLHWVKPIIAKILEKYPHVQFIYMGHGGVPTKDLYARFVYGEDVFEGLDPDRRESLLSAPPNVYPYILASLMADIAIAPLEKNYFNRFKTQCKYLEYAINGIPGVYSKWFYTDVKDDLSSPAGILSEYEARRAIATIRTGTSQNIEPLATGLLADTAEEWIEALSLLIDNATLRAQIGDRAREEVIQKYNFTDHAPRWQGFVEMIAYESSHHSKPSTQEVRR